MESAAPIDTVVFDLGNVLVDWDPRYLYRKLIADERERELFLAEICNGDWNILHDAGQAFARGTADLIARHPAKADWIRAYFDRWPEMMGGEIPGTADILAEIRQRGRHKIYALSNWSAETFPHARKRFQFFDHFDGILLSGEEKLIKPDPRFYRLLSERFRVEPARAIFIDDVAKNVEAAKVLGFATVLFKDASSLRRSLVERGVLPA